MTVEAALIRLGTAAVRTAAKLWLGDHKIAAEVSASAVDVLSERLSTQRDKRKFNRMIENFAEAVVDRVDPIIEAEFRRLPENERLAAIDAVHYTFEKAPLMDADLFAADLDARHLDNSIRRRVPDAARLLSSDGAELYNLLLRECCGYIIEISRGLPQFSSNALTELLRRDRQVLDGIREVLARLPQRDRTAGFGYDYRQLVARKFDQVELFGVTLSDMSRRYPLSVAYISLTASTGTVDEIGPSSRVEHLLARSNRLFIRGEAGLGKTTLLHWIAVRSAKRDFPVQLSSWNDAVPFLVPLRRYSDRPLPAPEDFLGEVGRHIVDEMPKGWVHDQFRRGRAILLVDGVDELAIDRRDEVRAWLRELVGEFPRARYVITSRPGATEPEWLHGVEFTVLDLEPMTLRDVRTFVGRWHEAIRSLYTDDDERAEVDSYEQGLLERLNVNGHLRKLAGYPLLCALLCALHKDRRAVLPNNRMELYDVALQMILERRDAERKINTLKGLNRTEKTLLLSGLAYWLIRNGRSDIEVERAVDQLSQRLAVMPQVEVDVREVYRHLLERSGLLREPVAGRVDFIHRTFQEYLAARAAVTSADDVGTLVANAHLDQWQEVVVMAVGHASRPQREELLTGLLERASKETHRRDALELLALASLETAPELGHEIRQEIHRRAAALLPPQSLTAAKSFASAGVFVLDLLAKAQPRMVKETVATVRAIAETGLEEALPILSRYAADERKLVQDELFRSWLRFDEDSYARAILSRMSMNWIGMDSPVKFKALKYISGVDNLTVALDGSEMEFDLDSLPRQLRSVVVTSWVRNWPTRMFRVRMTKPLDLPELARLHFVNVDVTGFARIRSLAKLKRLKIEGGVTARQLAELTPGWSLPHVELSRISDLIDLSPLSFLKHPREIILTWCSDLRTLADIGRWSDTLVTLGIRSCPEIDLQQIESLAHLKTLDLEGTPFVNNESLTRFKALRHLVVRRSDFGLLEPIGSRVKSSISTGFSCRVELSE